MKPLQRASIHFQRGEYEHAERICGKHLVTHPDDVRAWQLRGLAALRLKQYENAAVYFQETVAREESPAALINLAAALLTLDRPTDAARVAERVLELDPTNAGAYLNLAACYLREHKFEEAERAVEKSLAMNPGWPKAIDMQARVVIKSGDHDRAFDLATTAVAADPSLSASHRVLGDVAMRRFDYALAAQHYLQSLANNPEDAETQGNYALLLARRGDHAEALAWYMRAVDVLRDDATLQSGLADMLLIQGRLAEGWPRYSWRHLRRDESLQRVDQPFPQSLPDGGPATAVLDQGIGDQVLMASLIDDLSRHASPLEVQCDPRLQTLLQRSFPHVRFAPNISKSTANTVATPGSFGLSDVAQWLRPDFAAFPRHAGYLKPDAVLRSTLRERYTHVGRPVIGISWASSKAVKLATQKSLPLSAWGPLLSMPGVTFVNLQYDHDPAEVAAAAKRFGARIITDPNVSPDRDLDTYAAQIAAMDLVITTSTAAAHLAGALNVPTWVFIPTGMGGLWHWFLEREDSPWYPSVRLFRQTTRGDWSDVVERVSMELANFVHDWPQKTS